MAEPTPPDRNRAQPLPLFPVPDQDLVSALLPVSLTSFVGREREIADIAELLQRPEVRLVTLTGPGGVGKTRLALRVAEELASDFRDGVAFIALAPISDPTLMLPAIARRLGIRESGDRPLEARLAATLRGWKLLLVLDNLEHLLDAAPQVANLLAVAPTLKILATSRAVLHVSGEHDYPVTPLALPTAGRHPALEGLARTEAIALFVARARAAEPSFALTKANAASVAAICTRLDGLPLAIELAAARIPILSPPELEVRLTDRLRLLTGGARDQPPRLRSMRDAIEWSTDLLTPNEQALFRRLAVFTGGCTLEAAEAVSGESALGVLEGVTALVGQSLLRRVEPEGAPPRFMMLETIREYGLERLAASGEDAATRDAHAAYYLGLDGWVDPNQVAPGERIDDHLRCIEAEHPNLLAALASLVDRGDADGVLRLAGALATFWHMRGYLPEGRRWVEWALDHTAESPTADRGRALVGLGLLRWTQGNVESAEPLIRAALAIAEQSDDAALMAHAVHTLGLVEVARRHWDRAEALMERALDLWREVGSPSVAAVALHVLSTIAYERGDAALSARRAEESLALSRAVGHPSSAAGALSRLARLARDRGDDRRAALAYQEGLQLWIDVGERWTSVQALAGLAAIAAARDQPEQAATLLGVIDAITHGDDGPIVLDDRVVNDRAIATTSATTALGEERFADVRAAGRALPLTVAVAVGAEVVVPDSPESPFDPSSTMPGTDMLTVRERDVLRHMVEGKSNAEIAAALFVSVSTVKTHVSNILAKLGTPTRAAAATNAVRLGLV